MSEQPLKPRLRSPEFHSAEFHSAESRHIAQPGFLRTLASIILEPGSTLPDLLRHDQPPHPISIAFLFLFTVLTPFATYLVTQGSYPNWAQLVCGFALVFFLTIIISFFLQYIVLLALRISFTPYRLFASMCYALAPSILCFALVCCFNILDTGYLTVFEVVMNGKIEAGDRFVEVFPWVLVLTQITGIVVYIYCVQVMGKLDIFSSLFVALLTLACLYVSLTLSITIVATKVPTIVEIFDNIIEPSRRLVDAVLRN